MAFTLTFLGTCTEYHPAPSSLNNPRGMTLSYLHSRIQNPTLKSIQNGPELLGQNIYNIIANGVDSALDAILSGERTLNFLGHSRGGIEAILTSHELQRIQDLLQNTDQIDSADTLLNLLCDSHCVTDNGQTAAQLRMLLEPKKELLFQKLGALKNLSLNVNILALDPVPGGSVLGITAGQCLDDRFYFIPPIVSDYQQMIPENERSRGFKSVVPRAMDATRTNIKLINIPGHHSTLTGNPNAQDGRTVQALGMPEDASTSDVQDITLYEGYDFLTRHGVVYP